MFLSFKIFYFSRDDLIITFSYRKCLDQIDINGMKKQEALYVTCVVSRKRIYDIS